MRRKVRASIVLLSLLLASPALASTSPVTAYYPNSYVTGPASVTMGIDVLASVGGRCGFAATGVPSGTYDAGAIDTTAWSQQFAFTAECTAPWRIAVTSAKWRAQGWDNQHHPRLY